MGEGEWEGEGECKQAHTHTNSPTHSDPHLLALLDGVTKLDLELIQLPLSLRGKV